MITQVATRLGQKVRKQLERYYVNRDAMGLRSGKSAAIMSKAARSML